MWYQQGHDILLQYWSGPHEFVSCFAKKSDSKGLTELQRMGIGLVIAMMAIKNTERLYCISFVIEYT